MTAVSPTEIGPDDEIFGQSLSSTLYIYKLITDSISEPLPVSPRD